MSSFDHTADSGAPTFADHPDHRPPSWSREEAEAEVRALAPGSVIDRYVVLSKLGGGGMGVVYAAHDPELDRKVALKLLRSGVRNDDEARARLLREARALAKLSHENVVTVHDVGVHEGLVWLAMELISGKTLSHWSREQPRRWREVLEVLLPAGRGLAAAHAAGLLHRDIKPDNIMVRHDGRVCVMDFGLARARDEDEGDEGDEDTGDDEGDLRSASRSKLDAGLRNLTGAGSMLGTPAYMAPEQFSGGWPDGRTDQFSFCVTLWELLYRQAPFDGDTIADLAQSVTLGELRPPPAGAQVPSWLRKICERGMSREAEDRWPSIEALLTQLSAGQARARVRALLVGVVVVLSVVVAALAWNRATHQRLVAECRQQGAAIESTWGDERRAQFHDALVRAKTTEPEVVERRVAQWLDPYAKAWSEARSSACLAADVEERWDAQTLERALWCLDDRQMTTDALIAELMSEQTAVAHRAVIAVSRLPSPAQCIDPTALPRMLTPPVEQRDAVRRVRIGLARAAALVTTGRYDDAIIESEIAADAAQSIDWPPLAATASVQLGRALQRAGRFSRAEQTLEDAYFEAARVDADTVAADAAQSLISLVGTRLARHEEGLRWAKLAEVALIAIDDVDGSRMAAMLNGAGGIYASTSRYDRAREHFERALALQEATIGTEHPDVALTLTNLALVDIWTDAPVDAEARLERALHIQEQTLGERHPTVAFTLNNLASLAKDDGRTERAEQLYERALGLRRRALGPKHVDVAQSLNNLGNLYNKLERWDEAKPLFTEALRIFEMVHGPEHHLVGYPLFGLANIAIARGRPGEAIALAERLLAARSDAAAEMRADDLMVLARALWAEGHDRPRATATAQQARTLLRREGHEDEAAVVSEWLASHSLDVDDGPR